MAFSIGAPLPSHSLVTVTLIFPAVIWTRAGKQASESRYSPDRHVKATTVLFSDPYRRETSNALHAGIVNGVYEGDGFF
jgi:hypothetical protein